MVLWFELAWLSRAYRAASACAEHKTPVRFFARGLLALAAEVAQEKVTVVTLHRSTLYR